MYDKQTDLTGPGISTYEEVKKILPDDYQALLPPLKRMQALYHIKEYIEKGLAEALNLQMVQVPLIVRKDSGVNDYLDRDGSRTPVEFSTGLGLPQRITTQVVQAATKWKRMALAQFDCPPGYGINTDMRAIRKDYFLDHDHSAYVDQWDWEQRIRAEDRNLGYLKETVRRIWKVIYGAGEMAREHYPELADERFPDLPEELEFFHAEEILEMYPDLPRKQRETRLLQDHPAVFIIGIGAVLKDGYPHEMRAADYDDWITPTLQKDGQQFHGLNGDILVWNPVTRRRHELSSMGIRVTKDSMQRQLELSGQTEFLELPYHQAILNGEIPLSIGGGIGQARTYMYLLRTAHLGEVTVSVWPDELKRICAEKNIYVLE
ncbi:MAG: aspartate--ammonia ligase [Bacteroidetes bacterium]|jgi:aspartate--ammonia ligase|nr:aspartate--ammonia ligase [Bacteroidota bacterium]